MFRSSGRKNLFVNTDSFDCVVTVEKREKLLEKETLKPM